MGIVTLTTATSTSQGRTTTTIGTIVTPTTTTSTSQGRTTTTMGTTVTLTIATSMSQGRVMTATLARASIPVPLPGVIRGESPCRDEIQTWTSWSKNKKEWCCGQQLKCPGYNFDCDSGSQHWPLHKREYCCLVKGHGCPTAEVTGTTDAARKHESAHISYRCSVGDANWRTQWSNKKQEWCCMHFQIACPENVFNCHDDEYSDMWPFKMKEYCCMTHGHGCPPSSTLGTTPAPLPLSEQPMPLAKSIQPKIDERYDCWVGRLYWKTHWSHRKKDWCCTYRFSCPGFAYNCKDDQPLKDWLQEKREYCCLTEGYACPTTTTTTTVKMATWTTTPTTRVTGTMATTTAATAITKMTTTTSTATTAMLTTASGATKDSGIEKDIAGMTITTAPMRSSTGETYVPTAWSHTFYNCSRPYNCTSDHPSGKKNWTYTKQAWCCRHEKLGCKPASASIKYDCKDKLWSYMTDWSSEKKSWCCAYELIWCPLKNANDWNTEQKQWCCVHERRGCLDTHKFPLQQLEGNLRQQLLSNSHTKWLTVSLWFPVLLALIIFYQRVRKCIGNHCSIYEALSNPTFVHEPSNSVQRDTFAYVEPSFCEPMTR